MKCPRCQAQNREGARFCEECGARLALSCPSCGAEVTPGKKFCGSCGAGLTAQAEPRFASPQAYTPKHLAEKILTSRTALEGERKQVTVLFADLKGSMELLADRDPEEARKLLDPVLERMMEAVHRYEGTVNQVMGDGIMALFGAPVAHEDHAVRACYAALRMQESVARYAEELRRNQGLDVQIRLGLNSGEVVVRSIGSDLRMDYTAVGQTTHLAARMEQLARPGTILLAGDTLRLSEGYVEVEPLGPVPIKGLADPVEIYELLRAGAVRSRMQVAAARGFTRFVGRHAEMEVLHQALEKAHTGHGQIAALVGEPGVGKSRLFWELTHSHRTAGWLVLESSSLSHGKATPYLPVIDLLKGYFKIQERDGPREVSEKVTGKLLTLDRALEPGLPALLALLDVPVEAGGWQTLEPPERRRQTLEVIKRLLLRESQVQPLLVVFEDLHWVDSETQALLDSLIESLPATRLLLLVNYRPEYQHAWGGKSCYAQLRIDPLPAESAGELLEALLGRAPGLEPLKRLLIDRTEGNPFFLEESVRTLVETGVLGGERGAYRLAAALPSVQVPATVQAILAARIDRLPLEDKRLLQAASVVGKDVPFALLQAIAELPEEELRRGLGHLQAGEFLYEASLFPDLEYTFKHALTHEVAYQGLLHDRRRALHGRIVQAIERLYAERRVEQVDRLAHHAVRAELWDRALGYCRQAGLKAAQRLAHREAAGYFEQGLQALEHLPESHEARERAIDLRVELRHSLMVLGQHGRILELLGEARALAQALGDRGRLASVASFLANGFYLIGDLERAAEAAGEARAIAAALDDLPLEATASYYLGQAYQGLGDYRRAAEALRWNVKALEAVPVADRLDRSRRLGRLFIVSRQWLVLTLLELGEFAEALPLAEDNERLADKLQQAELGIGVGFASGLLHIRRGEPQRVVSMLERGLELSRTADFPVAAPLIAAHLAHAYTLLGRVGEAINLLEEAVEQAARMGIMSGQSLRVAWLGEAYLADRRLEEAGREAERAVELARRHGERGLEAWALRLVGEAAARRDPSEVGRAEDAYRRALGRAEELGMRPLMARCHLGLGTLHRRMGERQEAREHLAAATTMLREMDMRFWLEEGEAELKALG
ncbi:MAG: AAA family ATPase [Candidatus Rokubacteria bacterium]|nr:AAA family ATPase [Candidatus Rokubacteria bacterium]